MESRHLAGQAAVVTGGGAGIGRASALALADQGAAVLVADIDERAARSVAEEIRAAHGQAEAVAVDVSSPAGAERIAGTAQEVFGRLDILHNNAGIQTYGTVADTPEEVWDRTLAVNLKSMYLVSRACIPLIRQSGGGAIINTASVQSLVSQDSVAAYVTSKGGILALTRSMAVDLAPAIRVNAVLPGAVDTPLLRAALATAPDPAAPRRALENAALLRRLARPEEIGNVVAFLAGPGASYITGAAIVVDGGLTARIPGSPRE